MSEMLILLGIVAFTVVLVFVAKQLRVSGVVKADDLDFAVVTLKLSLAIVDEMNLDNEQHIKQISEIVIDALEFAVRNMRGDYTDLLASAEVYAFSACESVGLELTDSRKAIVVQLIEIALKNQAV